MCGICMDKFYRFLSKKFKIIIPTDIYLRKKFLTKIKLNQCHPRKIYKFRKNYSFSKTFPK